MTWRRGFSIASLIGALLLVAGAASAEEHQHPAPKPGSAEFERLKGLVGVWEGTTSEADHQTVRAEYTLTSGGSALVETLFAGTPHEMVSVYYDRGGSLAMTHYCMLGNRPELVLRKVEGNRLELDLADGSGINPQETHMHSLALDLIDADHLTQTWTAFEGGQPMKSSTVIHFSRVR